jgi:hypothetical protein
MSKEVLKAKTERISELAQRVCREKLDEDYAQLAEKAIAKLSRKRPSPLLKGREHIWAGAVVYALGQTNFLFDQSFAPKATADDLAEWFGAAKTTLAAKATKIRKWLDMEHLFTPEWLIPQLQQKNPIHDLVRVDGFMVPVNSLPPEYQQVVKEARARGEDLEFFTK